MKGPDSIIGGSAMLLGCLALGYWAPAARTQEKTEQPVVGRYQIEYVAGQAKAGVESLGILVDTVTGQCWSTGQTPFVAEGSPVKDRKSVGRTPGRFQARLQLSESSGHVSAAIVVLDTVTGQVWTKWLGDKEWTEANPPVKASE